MKITLRNQLLSPALLLLFAAVPPVRAVAAQPLPVVYAPADDDTAYTDGTRAMNDQRWQDAVTAFDKVINAKGKKTDAALYWKAYSLNKLGKGALALSTCYQLRSQFSSSSWNKDCDALSIDAQSGYGVPPVPPMPPVPPVPPVPPMFTDSEHGVVRGSDEDLKLLAINSLLNQDPAKAIPLLRGILTGDNSSRMKKHALFVLAQSKSPEAQSILHDAALGKMGPDVQREAIQSIAVFQGKKANDTLAEVYRTTSDPKVKKSVISAFFITQDAPRMVELAKNEKDMELKRTIVSQLALMHDKAATDYMMELLK